MIRFENVFFRRENRVILADINLHIQQGEHWVVLGKNGSGKTTILEIMNGYQFPSSGTVTVLGNRYGECDVREVRKNIGYVSQTLLEKLSLRDPVWEVVAAGQYGFLRFYEPVPPESREKALEMIAKVKLAHLQDQPLGLLSQGERKKILLARALMTDPKLMIMDEPCAGLDLYEREQLLQDLKTFDRMGIQMIYVTHHIEEIVPLFSHCLLIGQGKILAEGAKKDVLTAETIHKAFHVPVNLHWVQDRPWIQVKD